MEYTKDLILNIRYDESSNTLHLNASKWTSKLLKKFKKHKMIATISAIFIMFTIIDIVLITNFMQILAIIK